ncbi:hypothetical protein BB934_38010 (plasmid) [Microvirga ossetica]|uniref:AraC-type arabinose-binding/dimerisation domain-containing protein n=1 Tax=Microvirga ossetica TaxID=1882682 RepID=A0A1B2EVR4_9HYPH|nr:hypothetical protein [Microvirga ossetica]ANY84058.1 hypothetical protein BB934_38010 [Microvirga ossetica]
MNKIAQEQIEPSLYANTSSRTLLEGEIQGATVVHHSLLEGAALTSIADLHVLRVFFLISGDASFSHGAAKLRFSERMCLVPDPREGLLIAVDDRCELLEIRWQLANGEVEGLLPSVGSFPYVQIYSDCDQYRDYFKSEKTISRTIIPPHLLPRFCMGSVESIGPDRIEPHAHPMLDQLFFSLAENDIILLIDGERHRMKGNTLLHIPLGSDHGVDVPPGHRMHYLWLDFFSETKGMDYIVDVHKDVERRTLSDTV